MDLTYSAEQQLIQQQAREFFERECPLDVVRGAWAEGALPPALWARLAELGWLGAMLPEAHGGQGLTHGDLGRVLEEMGRGLLPGPYLGTLAAAQAVAWGGAPALQAALLPAVVRGEARMALVRCGEGGRLDRAGGLFHAEPTSDGYRLSGDKLAVPGAAEAQRLVVGALPAPATSAHGASADGAAPPVLPELFLVPADAPGVAIRPLETLEGGWRQAAVTLSAVAVPADARLGDATVSARVDALLELALACDALGGAQRVLELTVAHARLREAFGQPIGSYQAVKHRCADMLYAVENLRAMVDWAAWVLDVPPAERGTDPAVAVAMARITALEAYDLAIRHGTQIHGAIGVTEEHDLQLFAKRCKTLALAFGGVGHHHEAVLRGHGFGAAD